MRRNFFKTKIPKGGEIFDTLFKHKNVRIERIVSSDKIPEKIYRQKQDEWVLLLKGTATLDLRGKIVKMKKGDFLFIPSGCKHKVLKAQSGTVWLAVHIF